MKASFLTLLLPEGRAISDPLPVKSASIERAGEAPFAESASRCASRGHIEREIVINRPVEEVFDFLADGRNEPQYNPHMLRAEQTSTGPVGPGTLFRTEVTTGRTIKGPIAVQSTETFAAGTAGTHFRWVMELEPRGLLKLLFPLVARMMGRNLDTLLTNIKRLLEAEPSPLPHT